MGITRMQNVNVFTVWRTYRGNGCQRPVRLSPAVSSRESAERVAAALSAHSETAGVEIVEED